MPLVQKIVAAEQHIEVLTPVKLAESDLYLNSTRIDFVSCFARRSRRAWTHLVVDGLPGGGKVSMADCLIQQLLMRHTCIAQLPCHLQALLPVRQAQLPIPQLISQTVPESSWQLT